MLCFVVLVARECFRSLQSLVLPLTPTFVSSVAAAFWAVWVQSVVTLGPALLANMFHATPPVATVCLIESEAYQLTIFSLRVHAPAVFAITFA